MGGTAQEGGRRHPTEYNSDRDEDPVDAVIAAYVASVLVSPAEDVTIYGDFETGYIVTPSLSGPISCPHRADGQCRRH